MLNYNIEEFKVFSTKGIGGIGVVLKACRTIGLAFLFALIAACFTDKNDGVSRLINIIAVGVSSAAVASIYEFFDTKEQGIITWIKSKLLYPNKSVYVSFSYLFKMEVDGKYLLIKGNRLKKQFQPIGGVYKYYPEAKPFLEKLKYKPDNRMINDGETNDIRLSIPGKNILKFIDWFKKMENREYDPTREFNEELIETGLLPKELFTKFKYRKIYIHNVGFTYYFGDNTHKSNRLEFIYADIFEIVLTSEQKEAIKKAVSNHSSLLYLASLEEISNHCTNGEIEKNISNNSPWILGEE